MAGQFLFIGEAITSNGTLGPFKLSGDHIVGIRGVLGGATVAFFHKMPLQSNSADLANLPQDSTMSFTAIPAPFPYACSPDLPLYCTISGAGGTTNLTIGLFKVGS